MVNYEIVLFSLHIGLLLVSIVCLGAIFHREHATSLLTRLVYVIIPVGAGISVVAFIRGDPVANEAGEVILNAGMILWSFRILRYLATGNGIKPRKRGTAWTSNNDSRRTSRSGS